MWTAGFISDEKANAHESSCRNSLIGVGLKGPFINVAVRRFSLYVRALVAHLLLALAISLALQVDVVTQERA